MYEDYLAHHGIKGQKWGVRRFQNEDGTRTLLGKRHRKESISKEELLKSTNAKQLYKHRDQLTDKELQDRLNRLRNEDALKQMARKKTAEGERMVKNIFIKSGEEVAKGIAKEAIKAAVASAGVMAIKKIGKEVWQMAFGDWSLFD